MKILHVAQRDAAIVASHALHGIAQNVAVAWAPTPGSAIQWLQHNHDAAAVIVEVHAQGCGSFVEEVRGLGLTTPIVVVAGSAQPDAALAALNSGADGYVVAGPSLEANLSRTVLTAIDRERSRRQLLTHALRELEAARAGAEQRLDEAEARNAASLAREAKICTTLQQRLFELESALRKADDRWASDAASFADQLAKRHVEFTASLAQAAQSRDALAAEVGAVTAALEEARQARRADAATASDHLRRREAELGAELAEAVAARTALEQALGEATAAKRDTRQRAAIELAAARERQAVLEDLLTQEADRRTGLDRRLTAAESARQEADERYAAELTTAATSLAELQARYDAAAEVNAAARAAAAADAARQAELVERLSRESDARAAVERDLTRARMESARGRSRLLYVVSAHRRRAVEQLARVEARLTAQLHDLRATLEKEREAHERARLTSESELQRVCAEHELSRHSFDRLQSAFQTLEQVAGEYAAERARLEAVVADRDSQLSAQAERHRVTEQNAQDALARVQESLRQTLDARDAETARHAQETDALRRKLDGTRTHAEALRSVAERVPDLQAQLERSQNERRRQFERAPYPLCWCSQTGSITDANHSFVALLGFRRVDELRNMAFAAAVHDSADDLSWLLERARTTRRTQTVETRWKTREGRGLVVRLQALATASGSIEIIAEDITTVRALEERLRQAQRMEAVGRLAAEVAVTCNTLLGDVARGAHEWLARTGSDDEPRRHAERLLTDVTRATSFLRQLGAYGDEQARALEPVSARRVLRNLAPVLQRLVGEQIALVLPTSTGSFNVDVDAERVERVLINVAAYARERMPSGGQVRIDLGTATVGRRFVDRYPNVRPGDHVLITVTELPAAGEPGGNAERSEGSSDKPGVDLGVLVDLVATCGGHLWVEAQPAGNMVVKIHLPKPPAVDAVEGVQRDAPSHRGGRLSRWFRSRSTAKVRA
jgi:PAS domain S-box-containing protein